MNETKAKIILKNILGKLPVFLFCVLFISLYNRFFGTENSITGVTLLIGIFMLLQGDFGFNLKQATITIPLLYLIIAISTNLCHINPYLGLLVNFLSLLIILIISSNDLTKTSHLPFIMGYLFCQGYNVSGEIYNKRVMSLILGSLLIAGIYYLVHKKKEYDLTILDLFKNINIYSKTTQWQLKLCVSISLVTFIGDLFNYPRIMWINLALLSILSPSPEEHLSRRKERVPATIIGTILFVSLLVYIVPEAYQTYVIMMGGFLSMFISSYFIKTIYNSYSALGTTMLMFSPLEAVILRIVSNILGVILSISFNNIFNKLYSRLPESIEAS